MPARSVLVGFQVYRVLGFVYHPASGHAGAADHGRASLMMG